MIKSVLVSFLVLFSSVLLTQASELTPYDPNQTAEEYVSSTLRYEPNHEKRALMLATIAFLDDNPAEVQAEARKQLLFYREKGVLAIEQIFNQIPVSRTADAADTLIGVRANMDWGVPRGYTSAVEKAIWYGSEEARRIAIPEAARGKIRAAMLPMIDATFEQPKLTPLVIEALGTLGDERARFWLEERLLEGNETAALALAFIDGKAADVLRELAVHEDQKVREAAVAGLLERPNTLDLSALYAYYGTYPEDSPTLREKVRDIATRLELLLQQTQDQDAASPE